LGPIVGNGTKQALGSSSCFDFVIAICMPVEIVH